MISLRVHLVDNEIAFSANTVLLALYQAKEHNMVYEDLIKKFENVKESAELHFKKICKKK